MGLSNDIICYAIERRLHALCCNVYEFNAIAGMCDNYMRATADPMLPLAWNCFKDHAHTK
jgi:hypothetical protein